MNIVQRFNSKWTHVTDCWLWNGHKDKKGYGHFWHRKGSVRAHRVSWEIHRGEIPDDLQVLHHCDTPACVNPAHLYLGTNDDNSKDKVTRGRQYLPIGELHNMAKLTEDEVLRIRADNRPQRRIAADYGITQAAVSLIKRRINWRHIP